MAIWNRFQAARAKFLETRTLELLGTILPGAEIHHSLKYTPTGAGETELDGLVIFDSVLLLVECKAGSLGPAAMRGAPSAAQDLKALVADAHSQAMRARAYIVDSEVPSFTLADGTIVTLDKTRFTRVFMVTVALDDLTAYLPVLHEAAELGIFQEGELPWAVNVLDLQVLSELLESPAQFVHYLTRRLRLNQLKRIHAMDELDWFMHYLREGLYFENVPADITEVALDTYTTDLDSYNFYETGVRATPVDKPAQKMPETFRRLLHDLEGLAVDGRVESAIPFWDMDEPSRNKFAKKVSQVRELARADGQPHSITFTFPGISTGVTYVSARGTDPARVQEHLEANTALWKERHGMTSWVTLYGSAESERLVQAICLIYDGERPLVTVTPPSDPTEPETRPE